MSARRFEARAQNRARELRVSTRGSVSTHGRLLTALVLGSVLLLPTPARTATATEVPIGPRAIALGGAFSSLVDDATALYWNPAGLVNVGHQEFTASHADLFGTSIRDNFAAFSLPLSPALAAAADWYHSGFDDGELGFRENRVDVGFGMELRPRLYAGLNAKLLTRSFDLDATSLSASRGFGFDAGLLFTPGDHWRLAAVVQDLFDTRLHGTDGQSQVAYSRAFRLGSSWAWRRYGILTGQLDDRWHLGAESVPIPALAVRVGAQGDRRASDGTTWSCGLGFKAGILRVDWAREFPPTLGSTDHYAAAFEFNFNPSLVRVERPRFDDLYASLQRLYAREAFGSMRVRNLQDRSIETKVSVFIPELMDRPTEQTIVLRPRAVTEVKLTAVLAERAQSRRGDRTVQVQVTTHYASRGVRNERVSGSLTAYAPGAIDWSRGMAQAAAFVTPHDPLVESVARDAARTVSEGPLASFANRNVALMAAMVDALATIGVAYVPDPQNPFATVSETQHAVDTIYYPSQTLTRRTGDCDDTTVLLASLLANVGVPTRFVDAPGHIFLIAGTGIDERNAAGLGADSSSYLVLDHELWLPLETTATARGFLEAWRAGAAQLAGLTGADPFVDVTEAQARYEPMVPPGDRVALSLDEARLRTRLGTEVAALAASRDNYFRARFGHGADEARITAEARVDIARVHLDAGDLAGARSQFERALADAPQSAMLHHDLAVVLVGLDSLDVAESHFRAALAFGDAPAGTWLDLGLVRWLRGDSASALDLVARGIRRAGGHASASALLFGSPRAPGGNGSGEGLDPVVRDLLLRANQEAQEKQASSAGSQNSVLRLPVLPSGSRSKNVSVTGQALYPRLVWWE